MRKSKKSTITDVGINNSFSKFNNDEILTDASLIKIRGGDGEGDGGGGVSIPPPPDPPIE